MPTFTLARQTPLVVALLLHLPVLMLPTSAEMKLSDMPAYPRSAPRDFQTHAKQPSAARTMSSPASEAVPSSLPQALEYASVIHGHANKRQLWGNGEHPRFTSPATERVDSEQGSRSADEWSVPRERCHKFSGGCWQSLPPNSLHPPLPPLAPHPPPPSSRASHLWVEASAGGSGEVRGGGAGGVEASGAWWAAGVRKEAGAGSWAAASAPAYMPPASYNGLQDAQGCLVAQLTPQRDEDLSADKHTHEGSEQACASVNPMQHAGQSSWLMHPQSPQPLQHALPAHAAASVSTACVRGFALAREMSSGRVEGSLPECDEGAQVREWGKRQSETTPEVGALCAGAEVCFDGARRDGAGGLGLMHTVALGHELHAVGVEVGAGVGVRMEGERESAGRGGAAHGNAVLAASWVTFGGDRTCSICKSAYIAFGIGGRKGGGRREIVARGAREEEEDNDRDGWEKLYCASCLRGHLDSRSYSDLEP
jgi:hypothetical protein